MRKRVEILIRDESARSVLEYAVVAAIVVVELVVILIVLGFFLRNVLGYS